MKNTKSKPPEHRIPKNPKSKKSIKIKKTETIGIGNGEILQFTQEAMNKAPEAIFWMDINGRVTYVNEKAIDSLGYTKSQLLKMKVFDIDDSLREKEWKSQWLRLRETGALTIESSYRTKQNKTFPVEINVNQMKYKGIQYICAYVRDVSGRKHGQKVQDSLYKISEAAFTADSMNELYRLIHETIMDLMPAKNNFYIALYDKDAEILSFPYFRDEFDDTPEPKKLGKGLTEYVLRSGKPLLAPPEVFDELEKRGEVESIGAPSIDWLGVPLKSKDETFGVLVTQSYTEGQRYKEEEKNILVFISEQVAMAITRQRARYALRESEEKYKDLVEKANIAIMIDDIEGNIKYINNTFCYMFGYSPKEIFNIPIYSIVHSEDIERVREIHNSRIQGLDIPERYEFKGVKKDTTIIDCEVDVTPLMWEDKIIGTRAYIRDVSMRKKSENHIKASLKEKEALLREIHHRVKNNLQIISSLLNLQSGFIKDEKALDMFNESNLRVRSMAMVHEKLYRSSDLSKVDFNDYIRSLATHMFQIFGADPQKIKMRIDVKDVHLNINSAIPCGLIISELISNVLKHAFPGGATGEIKILFHADKKGKYKLVISDNGLGIGKNIDIHNTESFGLQLVGMLTEQLQGKFEKEVNNGTAITIVFKDPKYPDKY